MSKKNLIKWTKTPSAISLLKLPKIKCCDKKGFKDLFGNKKTGKLLQ